MKEFSFEGILPPNHGSQSSQRGKKSCLERNDKRARTTPQSSPDLSQQEDHVLFTSSEPPSQPPRRTFINEAQDTALEIMSRLIRTIQ